MDKLLNYKLVYSNETKDDLKSESQIFANSRVTLARRNKLFTLMGSPKSCKRYGDGASVVVEKSSFRFYTTTVTGSEGEGKQSVRSASLNRSN